MGSFTLPAQWRLFTLVRSAPSFHVVGIELFEQTRGDERAVGRIRTIRSGTQLTQRESGWNARQRPLGYLSSVREALTLAGLVVPVAPGGDVDGLVVGHGAPTVRNTASTIRGW